MGAMARHFGLDESMKMGKIDANRAILACN